MQPAEARPRIPTQNSEISYISLRYDTAVWMADELMCPCEGQLGSEYSPNEGRIEVNFPLFFFFQFYQVYFRWAPLDFKAIQALLLCFRHI